MEVKWAFARRAILEATRPILRLIGRAHVPPHYRSITKFEAGELAKTIRVGDVLLSHRNHEITNPVIPGYWKHAGVYVGDGMVIEAVGAGVSQTPLEEFCTTKDGIVCLRSKFATEIQCQLAAGFVKSLQGLPYDYLVEHDSSRAVNKAFYCSEIPWWSFEQVFEASGFSSPFTPHITMGVPTITPMDYRLATSLWMQVLLIRGEGN